MPFYNHQRYLEESLQSILSQTLPPNEILIIDDGSTDGSYPLLEKYQRNHSNVRVLRNEVNRGIAFSFNRGVKEAMGKFVVVSPADDLLMPHFFESGRNAILKYPEIGIFCGDCSVFQDRSPYQFRKVHFLPFDSETFLTTDDVIKFCRNSDFIIGTNSAIYRRDFVLKYGCYDNKLKSLMDTYLNYQIALRHPTIYAPEVFSAFRQVPTSYGEKIRYDWKLRSQMCLEFIRKFDTSEDISYKKSVMKAGMFSVGGLWMVFFLIYKPKFWTSLPFLIFKVIRQKLKRR
ncbi:MAG TPA: glycosyltransferase family A protein [Chlamydiales bacterium]|nr:glycosyltransferase family A protein [Chlamydiales bacterium]